MKFLVWAVHTMNLVMRLTLISLVSYTRVGTKTHVLLYNIHCSWCGIDLDSFSFLSRDANVDNFTSIVAISSDLIDVPENFYIALYLVGTVHLALTIWMVVDHFVTVGPNLAYTLAHRFLILKRKMYDVKIL